jgi:hypothetical protein
MFRKYFLASCSLLIVIGCAPRGDAAEPGLLEGHLQIVSLKPVEMAEASPSKGTDENYAEYPLVILSKDRKKKIARVTADNDGNYRAALPPGDYVLDAQGRAPQRIRAKPKSFTVISKQTVRVDFELDAGIR